MQPEGGRAEDDDEDIDMASDLEVREWERRTRATRAEVSRRCCCSSGMVENCGGEVWLGLASSLRAASSRVAYHTSTLALRGPVSYNR